MRDGITSNAGIQRGMEQVELASDEIINGIGGKPLEGTRREFTESALHVASQPFQYAANMGMDVRGFVFGELGIPVASSLPDNDPSQISCTAGTAKRSAPAQGETTSAGRQVQEKDAAQQPAALHVGGSPHLESSKESESPDFHGSFFDKEAAFNSRGLVASQDDSDMVNSSSDDLHGNKSESSASGDIIVHGHGHYNPDNDMILRLEAMTSGEVRILNLVLWVWLVAASGVLTWQFCEKLTNGIVSSQNLNYIIVNVSVGSFLFLCINVALLGHLFAVRANWHKTWTPRRLRTVIIATVELVAQWIMVLCFAVPNILILRDGCWLKDDQTWFMLARWTCWNTLFLIALVTAHNSNISSAYQRSTHKLAGHGRTDLSSGKDKHPVVVADLPFWEVHWWKVILWICMECSIIATTAYDLVVVRKNYAISPSWREGNCFRANSNFDCNVTQGCLIVTGVMVAFSLIYFLLYCAFLQRALQQLRRHSNVEFKLANTILRIQMRLQLPAFAFFALSVILLWYVKPFSCNSVVTTWLGMLPGQISSTVLAICLAWVGGPVRCLGKGRPPLLQVWLQEYAWTKAEKAEKVAKRNASMAIQDKAQIEKEPMFCVEDMLICLYWSLLIYDYQEDEEAGLSIEDACSLFRPPMVAYEMFWEKSLDTKCLIAWSRNEIILVFRGTASLTNVVADVQAWRTIHLPKRGSYWQRPKIHSGFDRLWRNNGLNERVMSKLKELFTSGQVDQHDYRCYITGHSLGGALATLAAYDIRDLGRQHGRDKRLTCITFGAPRTGNHSFAAEYNDVVPDSWNVINDQDLVARGGKFLWLYKRGGHRVIINRLGDLIVRPSPLEASLRIFHMQGSVQQHLLTSYLNSIVSVLLAQFSKKQRLSGAMTRIVDIVRHNKPLERLILDEAGLELKDMVHMSRWGGYAPLVAQYLSKPLASDRAALRHLQAQESLKGAKWWTKSCGCCGATSLWMEETVSRLKRKMPEVQGRAPNIRDGTRTEPKDCQAVAADIEAGPKE